MESSTQIATNKRRIASCRLFHSVQHRQIITRFLGVFLILLLSACATFDPKPFEAFNAAADDMITIDTVIKPHIDAVKYREMDEISGDLRKINQLALEFNSENIFDYQYKFARKDEPLFIKLQRFDEGLIELNSAFEKYAYLLATLAGDDILSEDEFRQLGNDLNNNLNSAAKSLSRDDKATSTGLSLFSTITTTAAFEAIQRNRKEMLIQILDSNQETIDAVIAHAQIAIEVMRDDIIAEYESTRNDLIDAYNESDKKQSRLIANQMLETSEQTAAALEMLKAFSNTYTVLALSHSQLSIGLKTNRLPSFGSLKDAIENVWKRYQEIKKINDVVSILDKSEEMLVS